jgi:Pregnancy-associated plasma protein-A/Secretion system C-terminal sorting domain
MRYSLIFLCLLLPAFQVSSKAQNICASTFNVQNIQNSDPNRYSRYIQVEQHIANYIASSNSGSVTGRLATPNSTIIVPVVVHVLHNGEPIGVGNNISETQIRSQIDVLNEDFRRLNSDRINTPAAFSGIAVDANIEFRLSCIDPVGNPTNGIHRKQATANSFTVRVNANGTINEQLTGIKYTAQGGTDAWPTSRYLNMWVCNIAPSGGGQILGYAQFPFDYSTSPNTDGVVMLNRAFGRGSGLYPQYDLGRTTTHEVGHWLNLFHIWGDDGDRCDGTDQCDDTPNQAGANQSNCPTFPQTSCGNTPNGDMFMNYMDYTLDGCKNSYSKGQSQRMRAVFAQGGPRAAFIDNYFQINQPTTPICNTGSISATNTSCLPITWSIVSGPAIIVSGQGTNTLNIQKTADGVAILRASNNSYLDEKTVVLGTPIPTGINGPGHNLCYAGRTSEVATFFVVNPINSLTYYWQIDGLGAGIGTSIRVDAFKWGVGNHQIRVRSYSPSCGYSLWYTSSFIVVDCSNQLVSVMPNPATDFIQVTMDKTNLNFKLQPEIQTIEILDKIGMVKSKTDFAKGITTASISVGSLPSDVYTVRIFDGEVWYVRKVIIRH